MRRRGRSARCYAAKQTSHEQRQSRLVAAKDSRIIAVDDKNSIRFPELTRLPISKYSRSGVILLNETRICSVSVLSGDADDLAARRVDGPGSAKKRRLEIRLVRHAVVSKEAGGDLSPSS